MTCLREQFRSTFGVEVRLDGHALKGASLKVYKGGKVVFAGVTGADGEISVSKLSSGNYSMYAEYLGMEVGYSCFDVSGKRSGSAKAAVQYEWTSEFATVTRNVSGQVTESVPGNLPNPLQAMLHRVEAPVMSARLKLQKVEADIAFDTVAGSDGAFRFPEVPAGLYVLHADVVGKKRDHPSIHLIRVSSNAAEGELHLVANGAICESTLLEVRPVQDVAPQGR
jgi:hypothetical protein